MGGGERGQSGGGGCELSEISCEKSEQEFWGACRALKLKFSIKTLKLSQHLKSTLTPKCFNRPQNVANFTKYWTFLRQHFFSLKVCRKLKQLWSPKLPNDLSWTFHSLEFKNHPLKMFISPFLFFPAFLFLHSIKTKIIAILIDPGCTGPIRPPGGLCGWLGSFPNLFCFCLQRSPQNGDELSEKFIPNMAWLSCFTNL